MLDGVRCLEASRWIFARLAVCGVITVDALVAQFTFLTRRQATELLKRAAQGDLLQMGVNKNPTLKLAPQSEADME